MMSGEKLERSVLFKVCKLQIFYEGNILFLY